MTTIAILGGTGALGRGLALWLARAGHQVRLGSRDAARAADRAARLTDRPGVAEGAVTGHDNIGSIDGSDVVLLCTPHDATVATLDAVGDEVGTRILVSCVNPLGFDEHGPHPLPVEAGSAAAEIAALVPDARVVAAFHHVPARALDTDGPRHDASVLVVGDDADARRVVIGLADVVTTRGGVDAGPLRHAATLEALTAVLIDINRRYGAHAGIAVTELAQGSDAGG